MGGKRTFAQEGIPQTLCVASPMARWLVHATAPRPGCPDAGGELRVRPWSGRVAAEKQRGMETVELVVTLHESRQNGR